MHKTVDIPKFMNALVSDLQSDAWDRGVKLVLDASTPVHTSLDQPQLQRGLSSLVSTLIHLAAPASSISVVTGFEPVKPGETIGKLLLTITATLDHDAAIDAPLALLEAYTKTHAGRLSVAKDGPSWAATLTLQGAALALASTTSRTAVVVDDDVDMQDFLRAVLESRGFKVIAVNDGFDALIVIDRYQPDVVLTDILMPNMNGIDLVGRIKAARSDLPVIVFSGYQDALAKSPAEPGSLPDYVLPKPMTQLEIVNALDTVLRKI